jgi:type IV pilus assembly protein PilA
MNQFYMDKCIREKAREKIDALQANIHAACRPAKTKLLNKAQGFSAIEMMVVVAIIGILAMIAIPSSLNRIIKEQVAATIPWSDAAKEPIALLWKTTGKLPADNKEANLPTADKMVSNFVTNLSVENGAIHMILGNKVNGKLKGKTLSIRPAVVEGEQVVPVSWICGNAKTPDKMTVKGDNKTNIADEYLPFGCR